MHTNYTYIIEGIPVDLVQTNDSLTIEANYKRNSIYSMLHSTREGTLSTEHRPIISVAEHYTDLYSPFFPYGLPCFPRLP